MWTRTRTFALAAFAVIALAASAVAQQALKEVIEQHPGVQKERAESARVRNIFYEPPSVPTGQPGYLGLRYKILLLDYGPRGRGRDIGYEPETEPVLREVTERFPFRSGMRFRIAFQTNANGYLYLFHKGSSSKGVRLFPDPRINDGKNFVFKYEDIAVPFQGWFRFDERPGLEDLYVFFSPRPIDQFNNLEMAGSGGTLTDGGWTQVTAASTSLLPPRPDAARGTRNVQWESPAIAAAPDLAKAPEKAKAEETARSKGPKRDIIVEPDVPSGSVPVACYVTEQTPILIHHIQLKHLPRR